MLQDVLIDIVGKSLAGADLIAGGGEEAVLISIKEMPLVRDALRMSGLMHAYDASNGDDRVEVQALGQFLGAAFGAAAALKDKVKIISATARLQGLMAGSTALRKGAVWQRSADAGAFDNSSAAEAGEQLRDYWFVSQPSLVTNKQVAIEEAIVGGSDSETGGSDDDDDESDEEPSEAAAAAARKRKRAAESAAAASGGKALHGSSSGKARKPAPVTGILDSITPKDGSLSALQTAALLFEEARVRELVAFEALPAVISADREPALELISSAARDAGVGPMPIWPYGIGRHPPRTTDPGMQPARVWSMYSNTALAGLRSWPVMCVASTGSIAARRELMPPTRGGCGG